MVTKRSTPTNIVVSGQKDRQRNLCSSSSTTSPGWTGVDFDPASVDIPSRADARPIVILRYREDAMRRSTSARKAAELVSPRKPGGAEPLNSVNMPTAANVPNLHPSPAT